MGFLNRKRQRRAIRADAAIVANLDLAGIAAGKHIRSTFTPDEGEEVVADSPCVFVSDGERRRGHTITEFAIGYFMVTNRHLVWVHGETMPTIRCVEHYEIDDFASEDEDEEEAWYGVGEHAETLLRTWLGDHARRCVLRMTGPRSGKDRLVEAIFAERSEVPDAIERIDPHAG
jgi:hypothetical protein